MPDVAPPQRMSLPDLAASCARETDRFFAREPHDPRYCYELLRRALVERSELAWELVYRQYRPLVTRWVTQHPAFVSSGEESAYFVNRAFERLWSGMDPDRLSVSELRGVLRYLQMCVASVLLDHVRAAEHATLRAQAELPTETFSAADPTVEQRAQAALDVDALWREIDARLVDDRERAVVYGSYALGLKPRQILAHYDHVFANVGEIYRIKENVLARLRRDELLKETLSDV